MREHTTHHDDCGCLSAKHEAEIARLRESRDALAWDVKFWVSRFERDNGTNLDGIAMSVAQQLAKRGLRIVAGNIEEIEA